MKLSTQLTVGNPTSPEDAINVLMIKMLADKPSGYTCGFFKDVFEPTIGVMGLAVRLTYLEAIGAIQHDDVTCLVTLTPAFAAAERTIHALISNTPAAPAEKEFLQHGPNNEIH